VSTGDPPSGVVTFLFTDIEGSTRRWEADADSMRAALLAHDEALLHHDPPVVDQHGARFGLDRGHFQGQGDGVGCSDLGDGRHLVQLLQLPDGSTVRRTEIDVNGATATIGRSDTVTATSDHDPAWTTGGRSAAARRPSTRTEFRQVTDRQ
jgi:hypothetical protein